MEDAVSKVQSFVLSGMSPEDVYQAYDKWAKEGTYDQDMAMAKSRGPVILAEVFCEVYPDGPRDLSIVDIAAGTGRGAEQLQKLGFTNIDAVDPSAEMLEVAKQKNLYRKLICSPVGYNALDIPEGSYDAVICVGGLAEGHLPADSLTEMVGLVKPGGNVVVVSNGETWEELPEYHEQMARILENLVTDGKIKVVRRELRAGYRMRALDDCARALILVLQKTA